METRETASDFECFFKEDKNIYYYQSFNFLIGKIKTLTIGPVGEYNLPFEPVDEDDEETFPKSLLTILIPPEEMLTCLSLERADLSSTCNSFKLLLLDIVFKLPELREKANDETLPI